MSADRRKGTCDECEKPLAVCDCDEYDDDWDEYDDDDWDEYEEDDECPICLEPLELCDCDDFYDEED